jgi:hypothetical protein
VVTVYLLGVSNQGLSDIPEVKKPLNPLRIKGFHIGGWGGIEPPTQGFSILPERLQ